MLDAFRGIDSRLADKLRAYTAELERLNEIIRARDEGIAWLRGELCTTATEVDMLHKRTETMKRKAPWRIHDFFVWLRRRTRPLRHPFRWLSAKFSKSSHSTFFNA